jgi:sialic acid synthase
VRSLTIGTNVISDSSQAFVIAELGHNHQGSLETCIQLIRAAAYAGASAVKLQKRHNKTLFTEKAFSAPYNSENAFGPTYGSHREALEFGKEEYQACMEEAKKCGVVFFATAFDYKSADFLADLDVPAYKIASGDLKSLPLLKYIASIGKPMIISTGGADMEDIDSAVEVIQREGAPLAVLQCTAAYPPKFEELNLKVIETFRIRYPDVVIGYSGHDSGIAMSLVAYILGARVIEKHFTLNRAMKGTDHAFSLEPDGMRKLVRDLSRTRLALGDGTKRSYESEKEPLRKMGKMIIAARDIKEGEVLGEDHFEIRSPAEGLSPARIELLIGARILRAISTGDPIQENDIER